VAGRPRTGPTLLLAAGEVSGDLVTARLAGELRARRPDLELWGLGGERMAAAGVELVAETTQLGAVGVSEPLAGVPAMWRALQEVRARVAEERPRAAVVVGNDVFHAVLARWLRRQGVPVVALFPPQVWLWRAVLPLFARSYDRVLACFAEEQELYGRHVASELVGHYLADHLGAVDARRRAAARAALGLPASGPVLAVLPGSRGHEVAALLPVFAAAARGLAERLRQQRGELLRLVLPVAEGSLAGVLATAFADGVEGIAEAEPRPGQPRGFHEALEQALRGRAVVEWRLCAGAGAARIPLAVHLVPPHRGGHAEPVVELEGGLEGGLGAGPDGTPDAAAVEPLPGGMSPGQQALAAADAALVASGTATLEAALLGVPMVIAYRVAPATMAVCRLCHRLGIFDGGPVGLPNLLLGERGWVEEPGRVTPIPELGQDAVTPENVLAAAWPLLTDEAARAAQRHLLARAVAVLRVPAQGAAEGVVQGVVQGAARAVGAGDSGAGSALGRAAEVVLALAARGGGAWAGASTGLGSAGRVWGAEVDRQQQPATVGAGTGWQGDGGGSAR
jgi:lipid A disaccharide synthetase